MYTVEQSKERDLTPFCLPFLPDSFCPPLGTINRQEPTVIEEVDLPRCIREALHKTTLAHTPLTRHEDMLPRLVKLSGNSIKRHLGYRLQPVWLATALFAGLVTASAEVRDGK